jgi:hypothetical protein
MHPTRADVDMEDKTGDDKPGWLPYVHVKEGEEIQFWDMHTPISIPKWAPKGHWAPLHRQASLDTKQG